MKQIKYLAAIALAATAALTSCDKANDPKLIDLTYNFEVDLGAELDFSAEGYWEGVYDTDISTIFVQPGLAMSHSALETVWDGTIYRSWTGFCPSRAVDGDDHTGQDWVEYQWSAALKQPNAIVAGAANSFDYVIAHWDVTESTTEIPEQPSCAMVFVGGATPKTIYVNNSNYGYWAMKNGTDFSHPFTDSDWCRLLIKGVQDGKVTATVTVDLAKDGQILNDWTPVDLQALGTVEAMYFQMESSDSGQWGMNNPAYFCVDNLTASVLIYD